MLEVANSEFAVTFVEQRAVVETSLTAKKALCLTVPASVPFKTQFYCLLVIEDKFAKV